MDAPFNPTRLLLDTRTSTDGSVSPKPRWTKGNPTTSGWKEGEGVKLSGKGASRECSTTPVMTSPSSPSSSSGSGEEAPPSPPSMRFMAASGDTTCGSGSVRSRSRSRSSSRSSSTGSTSSGSGSGSGSGRGKLAYVMAWRWLIEDEGDIEPKLQKPAVDEDGPSPDELPHLSDAERQELCRKVELRLLEVGRRWTDTSALIDEYLRFMFLRQRLENMLTLDPSPLVDDVWQAHISSGSEYAAFCERTFGEEFSDVGVPHKDMDPSEPIFYENTVGAYEHFFGFRPPSDSWPAATRLADPASDDADESSSSSGRRRALVRSTNAKRRFSKNS